MSDTPRTDIAQIEARDIDTDDLIHVTPLDFTRELERELVEANNTIARMAKGVEQAIGICAKIAIQRDTLEKALREVLRPYDTLGNFGGEEYGHKPRNIIEARKSLEFFRLDSLTNA